MPMAERSCRAGTVPHPRTTARRPRDCRARNARIAVVYRPMKKGWREKTRSSLAVAGPPGDLGQVVGAASAACLVGAVGQVSARRADQHGGDAPVLDQREGQARSAAHHTCSARIAAPSRAEVRRLASLGRGHRRRARRSAAVAVQGPPQVRLRGRPPPGAPAAGRGGGAYALAQDAVDPAGRGGSGRFAQRRAELLGEQHEQQRDQRRGASVGDEEAERHRAERAERRHTCAEQHERQQSARPGQS